jgi:hypothetical protein
VWWTEIPKWGVTHFIWACAVQESADKIKRIMRINVCFDMLIRISPAFSVCLQLWLLFTFLLLLQEKRTVTKTGLRRKKKILKYKARSTHCNRMLMVVRPKHGAI